jgi:hypothetical protein
MKRIFLSALIGFGIVAGILQILSGSKAARTGESYPLVRRGSETFKTNSAAPTPTPPGVILRIPLPESYPLVCRGGPLLPIYIAPGVTNIGFKFTHSTKPASEGLLPGQCSWVDRGMYDAEPDRVSQHVEVGEAVGGAPIWPETLKVHLNPENRWYEELHSTEKRWTFMVYNDGLGQLIATSARPNVIEEDTTTTVIFKPVPDGTKTWEWYTQWETNNVTCWASPHFDFDPFTEVYIPKVAGQIAAGFVHHWDGGHKPFPCQERKTSEFVGTVWFDLSEIFSKSPMPKAETATLTFRAIASDGPGGVCKDELRLPADDWMKGLPENTLPRTGSLEPAVYFEGCPPAGCSFDVTSIVNNWITGRADRYGFAISGRDDLAAIGTDDGKNPDNNAHCTTRYEDFSLTVKYRFKSGPVIIPLPVNLALNKAATEANPYPGGEAYRAVDGNTDGLRVNGSVAITNNESNAWWQVDLGSTQSIQNIKVWNRVELPERTAYFYVFVSDEPFKSTDLEATKSQVGPERMFFTAGNCGRPTEIAVHKTGRYVRVQLTGTNYLQLAEVEVIGTK